MKRFYVKYSDNILVEVAQEINFILLNSKSLKEGLESALKKHNTLDYVIEGNTITFLVPYLNVKEK